MCNKKDKLLHDLNNNILKMEMIIDSLEKDDLPKNVIIQEMNQAILFVQKNWDKYRSIYLNEFNNTTANKNLP